MPFKSQAQRAFMYIHHPEIAKRWTKEYGGGGKKLPKHVKGGKAVKVNKKQMMMAEANRRMGK